MLAGIGADSKRCGLSFSGRRYSPLRDADEGAPYSQTGRNEDVDGFRLRYINAKIHQAGLAESLNNILGDPGCYRD